MKLPIIIIKTIIFVVAIHNLIGYVDVMSLTEIVIMGMLLNLAIFDLRKVYEKNLNV